MNAQKVCAWDGSTPDAIAKASGDAAEFYLYNVGTRQFLTQGGSWGTAAVVAGDGIRFRGLTKSGSSYIFNTPLKETSTMILSTGSSTKNPYYLFLDQTRLDIYTFTVASVTGESNVYTISAEQTNANQGVAKGTYYISVDADGNCKAVALDENDDNRKWMFVTLEEIKDNFDNTHGTEANPAYAPHLLSDAGFYRENGSVSAWKLGEKRSTDVGNYYIYSVNDQGTITGTSIGYDENHSNNDYKNGLKPADALGATTTTKAEYTYKIVCTYTYTILGFTGSTTHEKSITRETPLKGLTEKNKPITIESDFVDCGTTDHGNGITKQTITLTSYKAASTTTTDGYTYYVGNGYNMYKTSGQQTFEDDNIYNDTHYQEPFGGYWTANIHGTEGSISQQITPGRKGWWKVSAKGFSNDGTGNLFAYAETTEQQNTDKYQVQPFNRVDIETAGIDTYVKASKYLNNTESQSVTVYVDETEDLIFGAYIQNGAADSWTCFDDFTLAYLGEGELNLIIDETNEEIANINGQSNTEKNQTLRLTRSFKTDKWNSLVLPVKLTAQQVKTAFGADTKLSALDRTELDGKRIFFEKVDLSVNDADAIEAGKLYIIKPQNAMPEKQDRKTRKLNDNSKTIESSDSYYTINQVSLTLTSGNLTADVQDIGFVESTVDHGIKMVGTYVYKKSTDGHSIPANSYILSDGTWYYHTKGVKNVKGLRGWIQTSAAPSETKFFINGVEEGEVTAIEGIESSMEVSKRINSNIYNLNGQLVRSNSVSAEGLDKGIYIIGGKKVVVK